MMQEVNHRRVKESSHGLGSSRSNSFLEDPLLLPSSAATTSTNYGSAPGRTTKQRRVKKRSTSRHGGPSKTTILVWGTVVAILLVGLAVLIGSKIATVLGTRRNNTNRNRSSVSQVVSLSRAKQQQHQIPIDKISINPSDYFGPVKASDEHEHHGTQYYRPHDAMEGVGDLSPRYAKLREDIDQLLPDDLERSKGRIDELKTHSFGLMDMVGEDQPTYDVYNCPDEPPEHYPYQWKLTQILDHWPTDDTEPREKVYQGLCVFDYNIDYDKAMRYRNAELPFVTINDPAVLKTAERWSIPGYVEAMLGDQLYGCEYTENNHFMYGSASKGRRKRGGGGKDTTKEEPEKKFYAANRHLSMKYSEWEHHANVADEFLGPDKPHWYFRLITCGKFRGDVCRKNGDNGSEYIMDELTFFQPKPNLYLVDPEAQAGVHCRFGMKGLIAENHWDAGRNSIAVLRGMRRYIVAHPKECNNLVLYPKGHPSARHSKMDWARYDIETYPEFADATASEVIMQPGQVLYLPATWFHYIISLNTNMQCNTRSGNPPDWNKWVKKCGF